jgi:hypothetical protein
MSGLADFVGFQDALDDIRDRTMLAPRQAMRQIARFRASYGKSRLRHGRPYSVDQAQPVMRQPDGVLAREKVNRPFSTVGLPCSV